MNRRFRSCLLAPAVALFAFVGDLPAAVYVSNLGAGNNGAETVNSTTWISSSFVTDNSAPTFDLDEVVLSLDAGVAGGGFFVAIYADAGGTIGAEIDVLAGVADPSAAGNYSYTATGITLTQNTTYWVVAGVSGGSGSYLWNVADSPAVGSWTIPASYAQSFNSGTNWAVNSGDPLKFSVSATAVPEPAALSLVALGLVAGGLLRPRRR